MTGPGTGPVTGGGDRRAGAALFCATLLAGALLLPRSAPGEERFWLLWEHDQPVGADCPAGTGCETGRRYASRLLTGARPEPFYRLFGGETAAEAAAAAPDPDPEAPRICAADAAPAGPGFDPLALPQSVKIEALRGVSALFVDLRGLKTPPGFDAGFGADLHRRFTRLLEAGGLRVLDEEQLATTPGRPRLNLYFSFTDPAGACAYRYSVFASLSQEVLLARDLRIKIVAGVWSFSTASDARDHRGDERDAILRVARALLRDHRQVNPDR